MQEACPIADFKTAEYQPHPQQHSNMGMLYKCSMKVISATKMRKWSQVRQRSAQMDYKKCEGQKNSVIQCCFAFFLLDFVFFWCFSCVYVHFEGKKQQPCNAYIITNNKFQKLKICIFLLHIPKNPFSPSKRAWKKRKKGSKSCLICISELLNTYVSLRIIACDCVLFTFYCTSNYTYVWYNFPAGGARPWG